MILQYGHVCVSERRVCECIDAFKNGRISIRFEQNSVGVLHYKNVRPKHVVIFFLTPSEY